MLDDLLSRSLQRCQVGAIAFPVVATQQSGARGVIEHEQWGRDGSELGDTGRKAYRGKLTAIFVAGLTGWTDSLYPTDFTALEALFAAGGDLRLAHPLYGTFQAKVPTWESRVEAGTRNGGWIDFDWIEQRASVVGVVALLSPPVDVVEALNDTAIAADTALTAAGVLSALARAAGTVQTAIGRALAPVGQVQGALAQMRSQLTQATRLLDARPLTSLTRGAVHAGRAAVAQCKGALARVEGQVKDPVGVGKTITLERPMTTAEFAVAYYGNARKAGQIRAVNGLASDTIPAGTTLVIS